MGGQTKSRTVEEYRIKGQTGKKKVVRVGDNVLIAPTEGKQQYVGRVEKLSGDASGQVKLVIRWYYRPHEAKGGRRAFHGKNELFLSDHYDEILAQSVVGKCKVYTFRNYTAMDTVGPKQFYCRFEYKALTGVFVPELVPVYCICEMPYNPDDAMVQCEKCNDWLHLECIGLTRNEIKKLDEFYCDECSKEPVKTK